MRACTSHAQHAAVEVAACTTHDAQVLARYGTLEQQKRWLAPLLRGDIASCFAMTEPAVASSDATNIQSSIVDRCAHFIAMPPGPCAAAALVPVLVLVSAISAHQRQSC